ADGSCMDGKAVSSTDIGVVPAVQINTNLESVVLERIELTLPKDLKSTYQIGETLNTDGIIVTAYYSNCSQKIVPLDECTISGWSSSAVGQKTIVVSYCGERASFTVTVEKSYSALVLVTKPTKLSYFVGQSLDLSGLAVAAKYTDQSTEPIDWNDCTISPFDPSKDGKQTITVTYLEKSVSFDVEVKKIELQSISISSYPTKRMYTTGESLDTSGLTLTLAYNDGSSKHIT
ncbi:MAG TPA: hypothetical protein DDY98_01240, partial [Ruminococcaceae bacterium]|nr:hypothetical protein [Oscillospiraceae bacterium]